MLTSILGIMAVLIAIKAHNTAVEANERAERAEALAEQIAAQPPMIYYHAPRPGGKDLPRLPDFIEQMEAK